MFQKEIELFLEEDMRYAYEEIIEPERECEAEISVKKEGIIAGLEEAEQIFDYLGVKHSSKFKDGNRIKKEDVVMKIRGKGVNILKAERVVLNFLCRMSGIATLTAAFVEKAKKVNEKVRIAGTRKTTPGFREYEKKAIMIGGGDPHRFSLYDAVIIKDNYIKLMGIEKAVKRAKERSSFVRRIEVEVTSIEDAVKAAELGVDVIMFDNITTEAIKESIRLLKENNLREKLLLEASGDINMENISDFASTGVEIISVGMLTHSARWLDFSLDVTKPLHHAL